MIFEFAAPGRTQRRCDRESIFCGIDAGTPPSMLVSAEKDQRAGATMGMQHCTFYTYNCQSAHFSMDIDRSCFARPYWGKTAYLFTERYSAGEPVDVGRGITRLLGSALTPSSPVRRPGSEIPVYPGLILRNSGMVPPERQTPTPFSGNRN